MTMPLIGTNLNYFLKSKIFSDARVGTLEFYIKRSITFDKKSRIFFGASSVQDNNDSENSFFLVFGFLQLGYSSPGS